MYIRLGCFFRRFAGRGQFILATVCGGYHTFHLSVHVTRTHPPQRVNVTLCVYIRLRFDANEIPRLLPPPCQPSMARRRRQCVRRVLDVRKIQFTPLATLARHPMLVCEEN